MKILPVALLLLLLGACSSTASEFAYVPTANMSLVAAKQPSVAAVTVADVREDKDPTYVGAIRGGLGNPIKTLTSSRPIKDKVAAAFTSALNDRGLYGSSGQTTVSVTLKEFSANQYHRREGHTTFDLAVVDAGSGQTLFRDSEDVLKISGSMITFDAGLFASVEDLRAIAALSLSTAIDQALAKPGFLAAVRASPRAGLAAEDAVAAIEVAPPKR